MNINILICLAVLTITSALPLIWVVVNGERRSLQEDE